MQQAQRGRDRLKTATGGGEGKEGRGGRSAQGREEMREWEDKQREKGGGEGRGEGGAWQETREERRSQGVVERRGAAGSAAIQETRGLRSVEGNGASRPLVREGRQEGRDVIGRLLWLGRGNTGKFRPPTAARIFLALKRSSDKPLGISGAVLHWTLTDVSPPHPSLLARLQNSHLSHLLEGRCVSRLRLDWVLWQRVVEGVLRLRRHLTT